MAQNQVNTQIVNVHTAKNAILYCSVEKKFISIEKSCIKLPGIHNYYNILIALKMVNLLNIPILNIQKYLSTFYGLPHRLEWVGKLKNIKI